MTPDVTPFDVIKTHNVIFFLQNEETALPNGLDESHWDRDAQVGKTQKNRESCEHVGHFPILGEKNKCEHARTHDFMRIHAYTWYKYSHIMIGQDCFF